MEYLQGKLKEIGAEKVMNDVHAKMKGMGAEEMMRNAHEKLKQMGSGEALSYSKEKLKQLPQLFGNFAGWLGSVVPLGLKDKKQILLEILEKNKNPILIGGLILLVSFWCCSSGKPGKTMKAPGRNHRIPRKSFENNPRSYFRGLRGKE